ncbi:hypothetical protein [Clostridioides difficile]|nr:hypothetical protein [Clostridioides difficile]
MKGRKVFKYDNGDLYKGEFVDGKKNGFGIYIFQVRKSMKDYGKMTRCME